MEVNVVLIDSVMHDDRQRQKMTSWHVKVVLSGIMLTGGCSALVFSTWGLFQPVVAEALNISQTTFALYMTVLYLTMTISSPIAGRIVQNVDIRAVLSAAVVMIAGGFVLLSAATSAWLLYAAGILQGLGAIYTLWLALPALANNWFEKRAATVIGMTMAFTGVGGALWSAVFTALISGGASYTTIYLIWAGIALVMGLPFTLLMIRSRPSEVGLLPYGGITAETTRTAGMPRGISVRAAMRSPVFYVLCAFAGIINFSIMVAMQFPSYTKQLSGAAFDTTVTGGLMITIMMVGQAIGKIVIGLIADRSVRGALITGAVSGCLGIILCWTISDSQAALLTGAFIFGFYYATASVLVPVTVRHVFGGREYPVIYSRISTAFNFIAAFASVAWAGIGTSLGFNAVFGIGLILVCTMFALGAYILSSASSIRGQWY